MESRRWDIPALLYAVGIVFTLLLMLAAIPYGFYTVFFAWLSDVYSSQTHTVWIAFYVGLVTLHLPLNPTYGELFTILSAAIAIMIVVAGAQGGGFLRALEESSRGNFRALFRNPLSATIVIMGATLLATVLLDFVQNVAGLGAGALQAVDPLQTLINFVLAPFIEEIGFRFFLIGVPLFIVLLATRSPTRRSLLSLWRPSAAWEGDDEKGLHDSHKLLVYLLVAISSIVFGLAHYLAGSGWEVGKISEAALDGVALAYVYIRYGLHTSIIFHWVVDYASNAFAFYGQAVYGIPWTSNSVFSGVPEVDILVLVGVPGFFYLVYRLITWGVARWRPAPAAPTAEPVRPQPS